MSLSEENLTVAATYQHLELVAVLIGRTTQLAIVGGLSSAHGRAEERAVHDDVGLGVRAGGARGNGGLALEVEVDFGVG